MSDRRTALVTGGTGSLGFRAAREILAAGGWDVVITGRSDNAVAEATTELGDGATGRRLDLSSLAEVRRFAQELPPVDAVVCNAGLMVVSGDSFTSDGVEETFGVNHLAQFLLVREILPNLTAPGRVVFVSSTTHDPAKRTGFPPAVYTTASDLACPGGSSRPTGGDPFQVGRRRYTTSKLCVILAAYEFARRVPPDVATFNVFDPGFTPGTGLIRDHQGIRAFAWRHVLPVLARLPGTRINTPDRAGAGLARMVVDPELSDTTGKYFTGTREVRSSADSYDPKKAEDLWDTSVELTVEPGTG